MKLNWLRYYPWVTFKEVYSEIGKIGSTVAACCDHICPIVRVELEIVKCKQGLQCVIGNDGGCVCHVAGAVGKVAGSPGPSNIEVSHITFSLEVPVHGEGATNCALRIEA